MRVRRLSEVTCLAAACALVFTAALPDEIAHAAPSGGHDAAAADALFQRGVDLLKKDQWADACTAFEGSMKLDPSVGAQINIARCATHDGKLAQAWEGFRKAKALNAETPLEKRKANVDAFVDSEIKKLEPRLPYVTIKLQLHPGKDGKIPSAATIPGLKVERDDNVVPVEGLDVAVPIDPGKHVFRVSAQGYKSASIEVYLIEGAKQNAVLDLVFDPNAVIAPVAPGPGAPIPPGGPTPPPAEQTKTSPLLWAGIAIGAVGAGSLIVSGVTGGIALSDHKKIANLEKDHSCSEVGGSLRCNAASQSEANSAISRGKTLSLTSTITMFAGAGLAATGIVMAVVGATTHPKTGGDVSFAPIILPNAAGMMVGGHFD